jgi:hypothetical protein
VHTTHAGKMSISRVLTGEIAEGATVTGSRGESARVAGVFKVQGAAIDKRGPAQAGETVALGKLDRSPPAKPSRPPSIRARIARRYCAHAAGAWPSPSPPASARTT